MKPLVTASSMLALAFSGHLLAATRAPAIDPGGAACEVAKGAVTVRGLPEASGVTMSRRAQGLVWSHNDSGDPVLHAVDLTGDVKGTVMVTGARVDDWEDVAAAPCARGSCLYIADIGDNNRTRSRITVYRVAEPAVTDRATAPAEAFHAVYPDGPHDAEALFVTSSDDLFIVTKASADATAVYRFPKPLRSDGAMSLQLVGKLPVPRITGAGASPDGAWVAVRTADALRFYRTRELLAGRAAEAIQFDVKGLREPQGEGVALAADGTVYLAGEGGGAGGTLAAVRCRLPRG